MNEHLAGIFFISVYCGLCALFIIATKIDNFIYQKRIKEIEDAYIQAAKRFIDLYDENQDSIQRVNNVLRKTSEIVESLKERNDRNDEYRT